MTKLKKVKKRLTISEEFEIMKLVLDKFLWIATLVLVYGVYVVIEKNQFMSGIYFFVTGIVILLMFMYLILREYEISK